MAHSQKEACKSSVARHDLQYNMYKHLVQHTQTPRKKQTQKKVHVYDCESRGAKK